MLMRMAPGLDVYKRQDYIINVKFFQKHRCEIRQDPGDKSHEHSGPEAAVGRQSGYGDQDVYKRQLLFIAFRPQKDNKKPVPTEVEPAEAEAETEPIK